MLPVQAANVAKEKKHKFNKHENRMSGDIKIVTLKPLVNQSSQS
jgi:hypothetical protein